MLDKTLGYILCCQSPALFLAALALLVAGMGGSRSAVREKAVSHLARLVAGMGGAVVPYQQGLLEAIERLVVVPSARDMGIYKEYFTIRDFFLIRTAGWIGLAIAAFFVLLALVRAFFAAADARREQKAAIREENERLAREAQEAAEATQAEPDPRVPAAPEASPQESVPEAVPEPAAVSAVETPVPESEQPQG